MSTRLTPGISSYTFTWAVGVPGNEPEKKLSASGLVDLAALYGLNVLQIADNLPLHKLSREELANLRLHSIQKGIRIETGTRRLDEKNLETYLDISSFLNSPFLRIVIDEGQYTPTLPDIKSVILNALPELKKRKLKLAIENHDRLKASEFADLVEDTDPAWVGICLDTVNSMGAGEGLDTVVSILAPLALNLHVKEFRICRPHHKMGFLVEGTILGEGMLPLEEIIPKLSEDCKTAILEQWVPFEDGLQKTIEKEKYWADKSIIRMKEFFKG